MKTIFSILIFFFSLTVMSQNQYIWEWQQVDSLSGIGQSQTALNIVVAIYDQARSANQGDQLIKAWLYRMKLKSDFEEDYFENSISQTKLEIQSAKAPAKQILHSILAELYWRYYQNHRWQILNRSETSSFIADDIKTWDLKRLVTACMNQYTLSLTDKDLLKSVPVSSYSEILIKQDDSEKFRPTLFDFLVYRAIDFYSSSEAGLTKPANTFLMDKEEYFAPAADFVALQITSPDSLSFDYQAIKLYREIIGFHMDDKDPSALVEAEIERLSFVHDKSVLPEKDSLFLVALYLLENQVKNHPSSTEVSFAIATQLNGYTEEAVPFIDKNEQAESSTEAHKWDKKQALGICEAAINRFPESFGAKNCRVLMEEIKQPYLSVTTNYASILGKPSLALVSFKNVNKVYFRLIKINPETDRDLQEKQQDVRLEKYLGLKAEKSWEQALPDDGDYRNHSAEIRIPALKTGYYILLSSNDASFPAKSSIVSANTFWITNISYLSRNVNGNNEIGVLQRESGQPLAGIKVQEFFREYNSNSRLYESKAGDIFVTDKSGMVNIPSKFATKRSNQFYLVFTTKKDQLITDSYFTNYSYKYDEPRTVIQTRFFTDRSIYRPGQTVYFKGIVLERKGEDVQLKTRFKTDVTLYDVNGQVVSKQTLTTNDFGSFSGNFIAPVGVLTGQMNIRCETGSVSVLVEEYKRPKFEVIFDPVVGSYKLGETITAKGKATAYAGSTVSDAKVKYRVVRNASFPYWWGWRGMPTSAEMEITNGETITGSDGSFTVTFKAIPDLSVDRKTDPVFTYTVYADVSDVNGESHSSETGISVGYKALLVKTDLKDDINLEKGIQFSIITSNLNGEKEAAYGSIVISKLRKPNQVLFSRKWAKPDTFIITKDEFEKDFPGEVYNAEDDRTTWPIESTVFSTKFNTPSDSAFTPGNQMQAGSYVIEIKTKDTFGEDVLYKKYFNTFQPESSKSDAVSPAFFTLLTPVAEPGEDVKFLIGTPLKKAYVIYEIVHKDQIVSREIINLNKEQKLISIPVKEEYRGNFGINLTFVKNNRTFQLSKVISVPYTDKKLDISFATFRNKLLPGQEEEWQIKLRDSKGEKVVAEMLAGMYDASLDEFAPHSWAFNIFNYYNGIRSWNDNQCFGTKLGDQLYYPETANFPISHQYDQLNWFGFNFGYYGSGIRIRGASSIKSASLKEDAMAMPSVAYDEVVVTANGIDRDKKEIGYTTKDVSEYKVSPLQTVSNPVVQIRKDFNETAFFFPQLATNENGEIIIKFKAPEALTRWKMMGLAYTKDLKYGQVEKTLVTQKELMIFTNPPRFLREGDKMDFAAKISNISDRDLTGTAELHFFDALTMKPVDDRMGLTESTIPFSVNKGISTSVNWKISIPEGLQAVIYRITATAGCIQRWRRSCYSSPHQPDDGYGKHAFAC